MKERPNTIVDTMLTSVAQTVGSAADVASSPAAELWNRPTELREQMKRHMFRMLGIRAAKIRPYGRHMQLV